MRMTWFTWSLLSALFAAATAILAKMGVAHVDSNLATAIRTTVVLVLAWSVVFGFGSHRQFTALDFRSTAFLMLQVWPPVFRGCATFERLPWAQRHESHQS